MKVNGMNVEGIIRVANAEVYGLDESIIASSYPMANEYCDDMNKYKMNEKDYRRARYLGTAKPGEGHDCYLKGILVQFDLQLPEYIWRQLDRYHFIDYISSQSKMHRILQFDIDNMCNKYVSEEAIVQVKRWIEYYNSYEMYVRHTEKIKLRNGEEIDFTKENLFRMIIANCPCGLMLTARMSTNYLQLKSIINQRQNHKMQEWRYLTDWFKTLPMFEQIVLNK
jgi:hypothetical protein